MKIRWIGVSAVATVWVTVCGCTEYNVVPTIKDPADADELAVDTATPVATDTGAPPIETERPISMVTPDGVDGEIRCGMFEDEVTITNIGIGDLVIDAIVVEGTGWLAVHPELPLTLQTEETVTVTVASYAGSATLIIHSNDPDVPERSVPLTVTQDAPPEVGLVTPTEGEIISPGAFTVFEAHVRDDHDAADALAVLWSSSVDGEVSSLPAAADGVASLAWNSEARSSGDHTICVDVTDSCGQTASSCTTICQNEGYTEESIDLSAWHFEGSALWDTSNEWVELTAPITTQAGTAFQTMSTVVSDLIEIEWEFFVSGGSGADGISLTLLDVDRMTSFVGGTGGGIGYYGLPGWSIEIDTWYNSEHYDPTTADHVSVHIDGDINSPRAWATLPEMEDDAWHVAKLEVVGPHLKFWVDEVLYIDETISGLVPFDAYVGFTAATGGSTNWHLIDALDVEGFVCEDGPGD